MEDHDAKVNGDGTVTITEFKYNTLTNDQAFLECLIAAGVDNWVGYGDAQEMLEEE